MEEPTKKNARSSVGQLLIEILLLQSVVTVLPSCSLFSDTDEQVDAETQIYPTAGTRINTPNVVLIVVDTLRFDHLGCYGYDVDTSPAIDRFASEAIFFQRAYSTAPWTLPSVASMMTGLYPSALGIEDKRVMLDTGVTTLAELFKKSGYRTGGVISHTFVSGKYGFSQGFDSYNEEESDKGHEYVSSPGVTKHAIDTLKKTNGKPFFLFVHYFDPHSNYNMHSMLNTYPDYNGPLSSSLNARDIMTMVKCGDETDEDKRYLRALYDSEIRFTDHHIGKLLEELKRRGLYENTLVVLTADHGEELAEREDGWVGHTKKITEELIRVPLMIKLPGKSSPRQIWRPVSLIDLTPTIAYYAGLRVPEPPEISGVIIDLERPRLLSRDIFAETDRKRSKKAVITTKWKLVYNTETTVSRLYNLAKDPKTQNSVIRRRQLITNILGKKLNLFVARQKEIKEALKIVNEEANLSPIQVKLLEALGYF